MCSMSFTDAVRRALFNVVEKAYWDLQSSMREYPLGFFKAGITKEMGIVVVRSKPELRYRANRLVIPSISTAPNFEIGEIRVAGRAQRRFRRWQPADTYTEKSASFRFDMDPTTIGDEIEIEVRNVTDEAATFMGALIGEGSSKPSFYRRTRNQYRDTTDLDMPIFRSVLYTMAGGIDPLRVLSNRIHMTAFAVAERAFWALHESGETQEVEVRKEGIAPGDTVEIDATSEAAFDWDCFFAVGDSTEGFALVDLKVGNSSMMTSHGTLPMQRFHEGSRGGVRFERSHPKQRVAVVVQNHTTEPRDFVGKFVGRPLTPPSAHDDRSSLDAAAE